MKKSLTNRFLPDAYVWRVQDITCEMLTKEGITCLILDIDNTLVPDHIDTPDKEIKKWIHNLKEKGVELYLLSNGAQRRVEKMSEKLGLKAVYKASKPRSKGFMKIMQLTGCKPENTAIAGDQLFTDILGGNNVGMYTILVNPITKKEIIPVRIKRPFEKIVLGRFIKSLQKEEFDIPGIRNKADSSDKSKKSDYAEDKTFAANISDKDEYKDKDEDKNKDKEKVKNINIEKNKNVGKEIIRNINMGKTKNINIDKNKNIDKEKVNELEGSEKGITVNLDTRVNGKTKFAVLLGKPVAHSYSPFIYNTLSKRYGINMIYIACHVEPMELEEAVAGLRALDCLGFNITIPHKQKVMDYIDEYDQEATLAGAVNTVVNRHGRLSGTNTDMEGFVKSLLTENIKPSNKKIAIIGAGGSGRAIAIKLAKYGECYGENRIIVINRSEIRGMEAVQAVNTIVPGCAEYCPINVEFALEKIKEADIVINTTNAGMHPDIATIPVDFTPVFDNKQVICDIIFNPLTTGFLKIAQKAGCKTVNGLGMLVWQAAFAFEAFTDIKLNKNEVTDLLKKLTEYSEGRG